jgi:FkbM family methyltransferase
MPETKSDLLPEAPDVEMDTRIALDNGIFERDSYEMLLRHTQGRETAIDIGAHVGSWTIAMAREFAHVIGFEPDPINRKFLLDNIQHLGARNIDVIAAAVLDVRNLSKKFKLRSGSHTRNSGMAHLVPAEQALNVDHDIPITSLDDVMRLQFPSEQDISMIKIDVEGVELEVLKSGIETIQRHRPTILLEINSNCGRYGIQPSDIYELLSSWRYREVESCRNDHVFTAEL